MIRSVSTSHDGRTVYGFTLRGIAWIGLENGMVIAAILLSVLAFIHGNTSRQQLAKARSNGILIACREGNQRHRDAIPRIGRLIVPNTPKARAQRTALRLLEEGAPEPKKGNAPESVRLAYHQISGFIDLFAPHYDCQQRLKQFSKP